MLLWGLGMPAVHATFQAQTWPAAAQWAGWMTPTVELKFQQAQAILGSFTM